MIEIHVAYKEGKMIHEIT